MTPTERVDLLAAFAMHALITTGQWQSDERLVKTAYKIARKMYAEGSKTGYEPYAQVSKRT
jgi:hypothetical protein